MKTTLFKLLIVAASVLFFGIAFFLILNVTPYKQDNGVLFIFDLGSALRVQILYSAVALIGYVFAMILPDKDTNKITSRATLIIWSVVLLVSIPFAVIQALFGNNEIEPILVFLRDNQMDDVVSVGIDGFKEPLQLWAILSTIIIVTSVFLLKYKKHFEKILLVISLILLCVSPLTQHLGNILIPNADQQAFNIEERVHTPEFLTKPSDQKNIVIIYLESVERSYGQIPEFKGFYEPIQTLADQAVEFTNIIETSGTNYTIAGMVSSQCGVPLFSNGLKTIAFQSDAGKPIEGFLPKIHCLGDQLKEDGYTLSYMNGASLDKFSKRSFYSEHGYTRLLDKADVPYEQKKDRQNVWGLNDALLFELATKEFDILASSNKPFLQSMLTISTHGPDAFLDNDCAPAQNVTSQIPRAIQCTGVLITQFVNHIKNSNVGQDTIVVLLSDHLSFFNTTRDQINTVGKDRRNLFLTLNHSSPKKMNRHMASFDIYPTLLETLGYELKDGRANLGFSAYSSLENLTEEMGVKKINRIFKSNPALAGYLWRAE